MVPHPKLCVLYNILKPGCQPCRTGTLYYIGKNKPSHLLFQKINKNKSPVRQPEIVLQFKVYGEMLTNCVNNISNYAPNRKAVVAIDGGMTFVFGD